MTIPVLEPEQLGFDVDPDSLGAAMDKLLSDVVAGYANLNIGLPERQYWTLSEPIHDCEQVVATAMQIFVGGPGDSPIEPQRCDAPRSVSAIVQVVRCVPTVGPRGKAPDPMAIQEASRVLARDLWVLISLARDFSQWDGFGVLATAAPSVQQGGFQAANLNLTMVIP